MTSYNVTTNFTVSAIFHRSYTRLKLYVAEKTSMFNGTCDGAYFPSVLCYGVRGPDDRGQFPSGAMTDSGIHPASYPMCTEGSYPGIKAVGA
jgi:hypothetical protein